MEFGRLNISETRLEDAPSNRMEQICANVVLVNKTHSGHEPQVYVLRREVHDIDLVLERRSVGCTSMHPFMRIGKLVAIDRLNKRVYFSDTSYVSYNHLIIYTGPRQDQSRYDDQMSVEAFQHLVDALRCITLRPFPTYYMKGRRAQHAVPMERRQINDLLEKKMIRQESPSNGLTPADLNLFEVYP